MGPWNDTHGPPRQIPPGPFGLRGLLREFILPPFNPGAGIYRQLTLIDLVKVLLTLAAGGVGYWAFRGHGILGGIVGAAGAAWLWRPLLLVSGSALVFVVAGVARAGRAVVGRAKRST
jgi:hypothetical protein